MKDKLKGIEDDKGRKMGFKNHIKTWWAGYALLLIFMGVFIIYTQSPKSCDDCDQDEICFGSRAHPITYACKSQERAEDLDLNPFFERIEYCDVEFTRVIFDYRSGFVQDDEFAWDILSMGGRIVFHPKDRLTLCKDRNERDRDCENITGTINLPCSYCVRITEHNLDVDEGMDCLSEEEKLMVGE